MSYIFKAIASAVSTNKVDPKEVERKIAENKAYFQKRHEERAARDKAYWDTVVKLTSQKR